MLRLRRSRERTFRAASFAIIGGIAHALREHDGLAANLVVGNLREKMGNAVKPRPLLVDSLDYPPRRLGNVGATEHLFLGFGVLLPTGPRLHVHRAKLPLLQRLVNAHKEAELLLSVGDRKPVLDQDNP